MSSLPVAKCVSECLGTAILVFMGCGVIELTGSDIVCTSLAFALSVVGVAYSFGEISGFHLNPAVSLGYVICGQMDVMDFAYYVIAQCAGAFGGAALLLPLLKCTNHKLGYIGSNFYGKYTYFNTECWGAILIEIILTFIFVYLFIQISQDKSKSDIKGLLIGLTLFLLHLLGIRLTGTSLNPWRSLAPAVYKMHAAIKRVWVFLIFPFVGGAIAGLLYKLFGNKSSSSSNSDGNYAPAKIQ
jgi:aquaporin Z